MKNTFLFLCFAASLFFSCNEKIRSVEYPEFNVNEAFELSLDNTKKMNGEDFIIQFIEVTQESRCPEGVNCIRAGEVIVVVNINGTPHKITKVPKKSAKVSIGNYRVVISEVLPYPNSRVKVETSEYKLKLIVRD